jgi:hypothetical protein
VARARDGTPEDATMNRMPFLIIAVLAVSTLVIGVARAITPSIPIPPP